MCDRSWVSILAIALFAAGFMATSEDDEDWDTDTDDPDPTPIQVLEGPALRLTPDQPVRRFRIEAGGASLGGEVSVFLTTLVQAEVQEELANLVVSIQDCDTEAELAVERVGLSVGAQPVQVQVQATYQLPWADRDTFVDMTRCVVFETEDAEVRATWEQTIQVDGVSLPYDAQLARTDR